MEDEEKNDVHFTKWDIFVYLLCAGYFITTDNIIGFLGKISLILFFIVGPALLIISLFDKFQKCRKWVQYTMVGGYMLFGLSMALLFLMLICKSFSVIIFA
ncbi:hypothetical protein [Ligilactobacillus ceti]|uniref:hypothetical protein n=1 Tax=Ligilactobacillus ceti TaxID=395085 RepID=UPI0004876549|nr:hypothetical protein [Ligilactobacillus ceti]